jgi:hypothetical protein
MRDHDFDIALQFTNFATPTPMGELLRHVLPLAVERRSAHRARGRRPDAHGVRPSSRRTVRVRCARRAAHYRARAGGDVARPATTPAPPNARCPTHHAAVRPRAPGSSCRWLRHRDTAPRSPRRTMPTRLGASVSS